MIAWINLEKTLGTLNPHRSRITTQLFELIPQISVIFFFFSYSFWNKTTVPLSSASDAEIRMHLSFHGAVKTCSSSTGEMWFSNIQAPTSCWAGRETPFHLPPHPSRTVFRFTFFHARGGAFQVALAGAVWAREPVRLDVDAPWS